MNPMLKTAKKVTAKDHVDKRTTMKAALNAIPIEPMAVDIIESLVSYHLEMDEIC